jgi:hypothetical protein
MQPEGGWDIRRNGHPWARSALQFYLSDYPEKPEVMDAKLFWTEEDRMIVLGLLLENIGVDKAVRLGNPQVWKDAISELK